MSLGTPASSSCQLWRGLTDWHAIKGPTHALAHAGNEFPQSLIKVTITLQPWVFPINLLPPPSFSVQRAGIPSSAKRFPVFMKKKKSNLKVVSCFFKAREVTFKEAGLSLRFQVRMNSLNYILKIFNLNCFQPRRAGQEQCASFEQKEQKVFSDICQVFSLCTNRKAYKKLHKISLAFVGHDTLDQIVHCVCLCMDMWNISHEFCKCFVSCVKKTSWNSHGCCCRSFNRGLIWGRGPGVAACTSTSHYVGVRTWEVGPLANNGGMTLLVCFPFQMWNMAKQEGEDESESWAWSHTVFEAARHRFVGLTTCTTTPSQLHFPIWMKLPLWYWASL